MTAAEAVAQAQKDYVAIILTDDAVAFARGLPGERLRWLAVKLTVMLGPEPEGGRKMEQASREEPTSAAGAVFNEVLRRGKEQGHL